MREEGFDPAAFELLAGLEEEHFWFRARNRLICAELARDFLSLDQLEDSGGTDVYEEVSGPTPVRSFAAVPELAGILSERGYRLVETDPASGLRLWRRAG